MKKQTFEYASLLAAGAVAAMSLSACGGGGGGGSASTPAPATTSGTVRVALTDAPACGFDAVNVTVTKVRVNASAGAGDTDAGWTDITLNPARKINLLNLTNGVLDTLGQTSLPAGHYSQVRLVLDANTGGGLANSVVPTGGTEQALMSPSASQSGLKLTHEFDVAAGQTADLVLDFDACKSVVTQGQGHYLLKPVIKVVPNIATGITGVIAPAQLGGHVTVSAQQRGIIVASTTPNATTGEFALTHLAAGDYDVVVTADNSAADVIGAVPVTASANTVLSTSAAPLTLAAAFTGTIRGTVTLPAGATEQAYVSASQTIAGGPAVVVRFAGVDLGSGAYRIDNLPVAAPQYAVYSATLPLKFAAATTVQPQVGSYRVQATGTGYAGSGQTALGVPVTAGLPTTADFVLGQ